MTIDASLPAPDRGVSVPERATRQDGAYPRPQLVREGWTDLSGSWQFTFDDARAGVDGHWAGLADLSDRSVFGQDVTVPFPPESEASGVGDERPHAVAWYRRSLRLADIAGAAAVRERGHRVILRCGAVAGFCYTQLTDTLQEANGLLDGHRNPKLPVELLRSFITGRRSG
jgi:hypothetical protein